MLGILAFIADRFVMDAVVTEILLNDAFLDCWKVLLMLLILAFLADKFVCDAVVTKTLPNEALVESWRYYVC